MWGGLSTFKEMNCYETFFPFESGACCFFGGDDECGEGAVCADTGCEFWELAE